MPWQNVRKWLEDEIETKDKENDSESLAEKLRAQISSDDFAEEMEEMKKSPDKTDAIGAQPAEKAEPSDKPEEQDKQAADEADKAEATQKTEQPKKPQEERAAMTTTSPATETVTYGIEEATELMRGLPEDHIELVALVVKRTLESTNVKVSAIIDDASRKQKRIDDRINLLKNEIKKFEEEIALRKGEIGTLESEGEEITTVKERLKLAEQLSLKDSADKSAGTDKSPKGADSKAKKQPTGKK